MENKNTKKIGRPTTDPKPLQMNLRLTEKDNAILEAYSKQKGVNKREAARHGIRKLQDDLK